VRTELDAARLQIGFAESAFVNQRDGRGQVALVEAEAAAAEADREAARAGTAVEDIRPMLAQGFVTRSEVERAEQALARAGEQQRLAHSRLDALIQYERPAAIGKSQADVVAARDGFSRAGETTAARLAEREAALRAAQSRVAQSHARLALVAAKIARPVVRSENAGLAVYRDLFFGADRRKPQVGDEVWPNQPLIAIPDSGQLIVETRVREIDLHKLAVSQRV